MKSESFSHSVIEIPWIVAHPDTWSMEFSRQEYCVGCYFIFQQFFPTQGWNLHLLHCRQILYYLSHEESATDSIKIPCLLVQYYGMYVIYLEKDHSSMLIINWLTMLRFLLDNFLYSQWWVKTNIIKNVFISPCTNLACSGDD